MDSLDKKKLDDEIDLKELFSIFWKGRLLITLVTLCFTLASIAIALYLPDEYKATAIVRPSDSDGGNKLGAIANQFGGLASLAGVNLKNNDLTQDIVAIEIMNTWGFAEDFIKNYDLSADVIAAKGWKKSENKVIYNNSVYSPLTKEWLDKPTSWELFEEFEERISIKKNDDNGLISISVTHYSPFVAKQWVDFLIKDINERMKTQALKESTKSIKYLEQKISETPIAEIRNVFSQLIQEQHKTKMLAQISDEFVFKTISAAKVPEKKAKPFRALIIILATLLGFVFSVLFVFTKKLLKVGVKVEI